MSWRIEIPRVHLLFARLYWPFQVSRRLYETIFELIRPINIEMKQFNTFAFANCFRTHSDPPSTRQFDRLGQFDCAQTHKVQLETHFERNKIRLI